MRGTRLLPIFLLATAALMLVKAGMVFATFAGPQTGAAFAQEAPARPDAAAQEAATEEAAGVTAGAGQPRSPRDLDQLNRTEFELLQDLRERRIALYERERQLDLQETILAAKEQQIDRKIGRLETLEASIQDLVDQYKTVEDERLAGLVKIYETMKSKDAARVFDRLELKFQVDLATRINPRKMSAILADMDAEKAKVLTTELARTESLEEALADEDQA